MIVDFAIILISIFCSLYIAYSNRLAQGYELLYMLPLSFGFCFVFFLSKPVMLNRSVFLWTFATFAILRYLLLPVSMVYQNFWTGYAYYPPHPSSVYKGILLMIYEIIISSIVICTCYKKKLHNDMRNSHASCSKNDAANCKALIKNKTFYIIFIFFSFFILITNSEILKGISFFSTFNRIDSEEKGIFISLGRQFVMLAKLLLYFLVIDKLHQKYLSSHKNIYIWLTYIAAFLNIGIFVGVNRKNIIVNAIASIFTINYLYPKQKSKTTFIIIIIAFLIFSQLTLFRFYNDTSKKPFDNIAATLQVYFSGPYNMALAVETREEYKEEISAFNVFYDIARPFYGIGQYFKRFNVYSSTDYFNKRLSIGGLPRNDQIMPVTGEGLLHFGYILSPIYLILTVMLGFYLDKKLSKAEKLEEKYILILLCAILGEIMGLNFVIIVNQMTFNGVLFYLVYWLNSKIILVSSTKLTYLSKSAQFYNLLN
ncbi:MAG TPA: hypothetical protein GXX43_10260 [Tepidanaerobacter syntrophicus]|nr:hypothetical protein [Tepidanaerobacter syntrophicus]